MSQPSLHVAVIGAGIVGLSTAIWLQRFGNSVTLIDKEGPAAGASFGNGGVLANIAVVPVVTPGIWRTAPRMLLDPDAPLFLKWRYLPKLLPFLRSYLKQSDAQKVGKTAKALAQLLHDAPDQHRALAEGTKAAQFIGPGNYIYVYSDKQAFEKDAFGWDLRRKHGFQLAELNGEEIAQFDPALGDRFGFGVLSKHSGMIRDPGAYIEALYAHFLENGGTFEQAEITSLAGHSDLATAACATVSAIDADAFVVAMGAWSNKLAKALGVSVPLESERGYSIDFHNPNITLKAPTMIAASKFVVTPMNGRLRAAGIVEFGGLKAPPSTAPFDLLRRKVAEHFPHLTYSHATEWMGHRPAPSDSIPVIGASPRFRNVYFGYGHHHVGLTGGPKTGRLLAQLLSGRTPNEDMSPYSPDRRL